MEDQVSILVILKITIDGFEDLGLPVPEGRMKALSFNVQKIKRLSGCQIGLKNMPLAG